MARRGDCSLAVPSTNGLWTSLCHLWPVMAAILMLVYDPTAILLHLKHRRGFRKAFLWRLGT